MPTIASGQREWDEGAYVVRRPLVTDAIGGALQRSFAHSRALPDEMLRLIDHLDRASRRH